MKPHPKPLPLFLAILVGFSLFGLLFWNLNQTKPVYAAVITVNTSADEYNSDGDCSLREAIMAANTDTAVDACTPGSDHDEIQFSLASPAVITLTQGQLVVENDPLTLTGPGSDQLTISGNNAVRLFDIAAGIPVSLTGLTLGNGRASSGGAIRSAGNLVIADAIFLHNSANADGGALSVTGNLTLTNTDVLSNTASGEGGGVKVTGEMVVVNGRFQNNQSGSYGGGIHANTNISINGTQFVSNTAALYAGGVWAWANATIANASFSQNSATNLNAGAIYVRYDLALTDSTFSSNSAGQNIGAIWASRDASIVGSSFSGNSTTSGRSAAVQVHGSLWLTNTQWLSNQSALPGGALVYLGGNGRIVNTLFAQNVGGDATFEHDGAVDILHTTFAAPDPSSHAALTSNAAGSISVQNSLFSGHPTALEVITGTVSEDYNLFAGTTAVSGTVTQGDHSFAGDAGFVDAASGNYHLTASSEALNVGADLGISTDWDGDARPGGGGFDLGYDETSFTSDVALAKTAVSTPGPNQPISYYLTFSNSGTALLPRLTITDALPVQVVAPITISSTVAISQTSTDPYVWQVHNLAPGASGIITVSGVLSDVLPYGLITNTATIASLAQEVNLANNSAQASIDVPNIGPIAVDDIKTIGEDETVVLNPTLNDIDGDVLTIESITTPGNGTAVLSGTQQIVYTPTLEFSGQDSFSYTVSDGLSSDSAIITLTVTAENDAPIITEGAAISQTMSEDSSPTPFSLTLNATDAENSPLAWSISSQPAHGTAQTSDALGNSSPISYAPVANYFGSDQFQVQVSDGALTDTITVNVTVESVNDAPVGQADFVVVLSQPSGDLTLLAASSFTVLANDTDVENDALTVTQVGTPDQGGSVSLTGKGILQTYTPQPGLSQTELVTYTVSDGDLSDISTLIFSLAEGADGGIAGDSFSVPNLGDAGDFSVGTQIPANVAPSDNLALIFNLTSFSSAADANAPAPAAPSGYVPAGLTFNLVPMVDGFPASSDYRFAQPVTLVIDYAETAVANIGPSENSLGLYYQEGSSWQTAGVHIVSRDATNHRLTVTVDRGGTFGLFHVGLKFLPLITHNYFTAPDLIVQSVTVLDAGRSAASPGNVQIVIKNVGNAAVTEEFWVDLYVNPQTVPTAVNQTWNLVGAQGAAWGVLANALPLYPGESLTLTLSSPYYDDANSHILWPLAANAQLYAQVDSTNPGSSSGAVREYHEINGDPYNNIFAPN
ncbi:MAG: Ig-like domain-containing protein [Candidatus Promineifilaceae bacterium]|nr:tandem-95 repeat protein [Anaerolineaceae bacterium]